MTIAFYIDRMRRRVLTLLAGPFHNEETARRYYEPTVNLDMALDQQAAFDEHSVMSINDYLKPGILNDALGIPPADIVSANDN